MSTPPASQPAAGVPTVGAPAVAPARALTAPAHAASARLPAVPAIDWARALACQLIVWHHLVMYGPLAGGLDALAPELASWLAADARMAVQVFLVVGGFLAARSLWPAPQQARVDLAGWWQVAWRRVLRLGPLYWFAISVAVLAAAAARAVMADEDTPAAPGLGQWLAHLLFMQDLLEEPSLSTGLWYVAIDLQLFMLLALLAGLARRVAGAWLLLPALCVAAMLWFNLEPELDVWAIYHFGAYGLGVLAHWALALGRARLGSWLLAGLSAAALAFEWRERLLLAGLSAVLLLRLPLRAPAPAAVAWLAKVSYGTFLLHYPVSLLVSALHDSCWPEQAWLQPWALAATWGLSLLAGWGAWALFERQSKQS